MIVTVGADQLGQAPWIPSAEPGPGQVLTIAVAGRRKGLIV